MPINNKNFGPNKTWRGVVVMPLSCMIGSSLTSFLLQYFSVKTSFFNESTLIIGLLLGLFYILFELPNSFYKRIKGIKSGELPEKNYGPYLIMDQIDSGFGCLIVYNYFFNLSFISNILFLLWGLFIHLKINYILYLLNLRKRPV